MSQNRYPTIIFYSIIDEVPPRNVMCILAGSRMHVCVYHNMCASNGWTLTVIKVRFTIRFQDLGFAGSNLGVGLRLRFSLGGGHRVWD